MIKQLGLIYYFICYYILSHAIHFTADEIGIMRTVLHMWKRQAKWIQANTADPASRGHKSADQRTNRTTSNDVIFEAPLSMNDI